MNRTIRFLYLLMLVATISIRAQWSGNPETPKEIVLETNDPTSITTVDDKQDGVFIFWEDRKGKNESSVFYQHMTSTGEVSFRADGKAVSGLPAKKQNPVSSGSALNSALVLWKQNVEGKYPQLVAQRVQSNGIKVWDENGVVITKGDEDIYSYSIDGNKSGQAFIAWLGKSQTTPTSYKVGMQRVAVAGTPDLKVDGINISESVSSKNLVKVIADNFGGAFVFWMEYKNSLNYIMYNYLTAEGHLLYGDTHLQVCTTDKIVTGFNVIKIGGNQIYITWQTQAKENNIFHQVLNRNGIPSMPASISLLSLPQGENSNPVPIVSSDSAIILSWINDKGSNKEIFVQKYTPTGVAIWNKAGVQVTNLKGEQFAQTISADNDGGAVITWLDRRSGNAKTDIYSQRIDKNGNPKWTTNAVPVSISPSQFKSYLTSLSDRKAGSVVVFKEASKTKSAIYAQHIIGDETYAPAIVDFTAVPAPDKIIFYWKSVNEINVKGFKLEELVKNDGKETWVQVEYVLADALMKNRYQIYHQPQSSGSLSYRLSLLDQSDNTKYTANLKIDFNPKNDKVVYVAQNVPNPFSESTTIGYEISKSQNVKFEFFNSKFDLVKEQTIANAPAGKNNFVFEGKDLPVGIYFYRFTAGDFVEVKKMVISR